jgi:UDP-N-acetylglucosamine/UDP-N-acetylgalactosamine diphosphorylase
LNDVAEDGKLVAAAPPPGFERDRRPHAYSKLVRVVRNNVLYLANLTALETWYREVRAPFFARQELGDLVYAGALEMLSLAKEERIKRLTAMAAKVPAATPAGRAFRDHASELCALFEGNTAGADGTAFLDAFKPSLAAASGTYVETIQGLAPAVQDLGRAWLQAIVDAYCASANELARDMDLFDNRS